MLWLSVARTPSHGSTMPVNSARQMKNLKVDNNPYAGPIPVSPWSRPLSVLSAQLKAPWVVSRTEPSDAARSPCNRASHIAFGSKCIFMMRRISISHGANALTKSSKVSERSKCVSMIGWIVGATRQWSGSCLDDWTSTGQMSFWSLSSSRIRQGWKRNSPGIRVGMHTWYWLCPTRT